jgi:hypothetical protein
MSQERAILRGKLVGLEDDAKKLRLKLAGEADQVRLNLNVAIHGVDGLEVDLAGAAFDDLSLHYAELQGKRLEIERIKKELDG